MGWASGETSQQIMEFVLEQGYGCDVQVVPTDTVHAVTSLAENGQPDVVLKSG
jgi:ABC-type proline/glycine betaine transport systems, periplasmic components